MTTMKQIRNAVQCDQISRLKDGSIMFRNGYFYRHGRSAEQFHAAVMAALTRAGIQFTASACGDHYTTFNGGASLARSSHFWVQVTGIET